MEDDAELLDWGGEEDEHTAERPFDAEDVVSIGGEEDDLRELAAYRNNEQSLDVAETVKAWDSAPPGSSSSSAREQKGDGSRVEQNDPSTGTSPTQPSLKRSSSSRGLPLIPGLPPKPVVTAETFRDLDKARDSSRPEKERRRVASISNGVEGGGALPPDWEIRHSRSGDTTGDVYYYNTKSHKSQWDRPTLEEESGAKEQPRGVENTRTANDTDRSRSDRYPDTISKRPPSPRPRSPTEDSRARLTFDDRHYRPSDEPSTRGPRERRNTSPAPSKHYSRHDDRPSDSFSTSKRGEHVPERTPREEPEKLPRAQSGRAYEAERGLAPKNSNLGPSEHSSRATSKGQRDDTDRVWMERHESLSTVSHSPDSRLRQAQDFRENASSRSQFKEPLPRQPAPTSEAKSRHRRHVSRSPPPHIDRDQDRRSREAASSYEPGPNESRTRIEISDSGWNEGVRASRSRNDSPPSRRLADTYLHNDYDLSSRRAREPELSSKELMGPDAKRRRTDERTSDSTYARRGRSESPIERSRTGSATYHEPRSEAIPRDDYRPSYRDAGGRPPSPPHSTRADPFMARSRDEARGYKIPAGPRHSYPSRDAQLPDERVETYTRDLDHRDARLDRISKEADPGRRTGRFDNLERKGDEHPSRRENGARPMDVDIPASIVEADRVYGDVPRGIGGYGDRPEVKAKDSTPTAPRAMASKSSGQLPSQPTFGPKGPSSSRFAPQDNGWPARDRAASGQRPSKFGEVQRPDGRRSPPASREPVDRHGNIPERPIEPPNRDRALPYPAGPKALERNPRHGPSPKLTGANNIAVPPTKIWTVNPSRKDDPMPISMHEDRQSPVITRSSSRWDNMRDASENARLEPPHRIDRTQSAPYPSRRDESANERPVIVERASPLIQDRIVHERSSTRRDDETRLSPHFEHRRSTRFDKPTPAETHPPTFESEETRKWIPRDEVPEGYEDRLRGVRRDPDIRSGPGGLEPEPALKHRVHSNGPGRSGSIERSFESDRSISNQMAVYSERDQDRVIPTRAPPSELGPDDRYRVSRNAIPLTHPLDIDEAPRDRKIDHSRFSDDGRNPLVVDDVRKPHLPRLPAEGVPLRSDRGIESRLADPEPGNQSRAGGPIRIRRPNTKFGDSSNVLDRLGPSNEDRDLVINDHDGSRPPAVRSSSLLERLNMATGTDSRSTPSLRERVDFPSNSRDKDPAGMGDVYIAENGDGDGDSRRASWKGRSRRERSRRPKGRGSYGNV